MTTLTRIALGMSLAIAACGGSNPSVDEVTQTEDDTLAGATSGAWTWKTFGVWGGLWTRSYYEGVGQFDVMFGGAGALEMFRYVPNGEESLLAPSYLGEHTDRVVQGTLWVNNVEADDTPANWNILSERRWNVTQAGNQVGTFSRTLRVASAGNRTDIWSVADKQWFSVLQDDFAGSDPLPTLTRYERLDAGVLKIRRVVRLPRIVKNGVEQSKPALYYESWTPFASTPSTFDGLALGLDAGGTPNWWYQSGYNVPYYPNFPVSQTNGYGVVYKIGQHASAPVVGLVFSREEVEVHAAAGSKPAQAWSVLNSMGWTDGPTNRSIAVLPAVRIVRAKPGTLLDIEIRLVPRSRSSEHFVDLLEKNVSEAEHAELYEPGAPLPAELAAIAVQLETDLHDHGGARTNALAPLAGY